MIAEGSSGKVGGKGGGTPRGGNRGVGVEGGKSKDGAVLPPSAFTKARVKRIMRLCPDTRTVSAESIFVVSKMTEEFVKHLARESKKIADKDSRKTLRPNDIYEAVTNNKRKLGFLEDCFGPLLSDQIPGVDKPPQNVKKNSKVASTSSVLNLDSSLQADTSSNPAPPVDL